LEQELANLEDYMVESVALGKENSYFCLLSTGHWKSGNLPYEMNELIYGNRFSLPPIEEASMGPAGEWFVRFVTGDWKCNGHTYECDEALATLEKKGHSIVNIQFGHGSTWLITYE
jgi:hypothetical protein